MEAGSLIDILIEWRDGLYYVIVLGPDFKEELGPYGAESEAMTVAENVRQMALGYGGVEITRGMRH